MTSQSEIAEFCARLRERHHQLSQLTDNGGTGRTGGAANGLAADIAAWREELVAADEELRVQCEELAAARLQVETLVARNEAVVGPDRTADVITDTRGTVVQANRVALQLFNRSERSDRRTTFATWFAPPDRRRIESLISRATVAGRRMSARVTVPGTGPAVEEPFTVSVELRVEPHTGSALLCWALTPVARPAQQSGESSEHVGSVRDEPALTPDDRDDLVRRVLSTARADLAAQLSADTTPDAWLARVLELAVRWVPGAEQASISVGTDQDTPTTVCATPAAAAVYDHAQTELRQGPMIDVLAGSEAIRVDDLTADARWPDIPQRALHLDVRSVLVCPLPVMHHGGGTISLYARRPAAFTPVSEIVLPVFASRASIALAYVDQVSNLRRAIDSRQRIGQAVGILMERHKLTPERAFERLVHASQHGHIKLRDLAEHVCETGQDPEDIRG